MLIIICRCWPLIHPFIYLFWKHVCAHLDGLWNLKQRGKIPSFWGMLNSVRDQPQHGHLHHLQMACVCERAQKRSRTHSKAEGSTQTRSHTHLSPSSFLLLLLSLSLWVVLEYLRCVIRHWFPSEPEAKKKYLTERYIKRGHSEFLTFFPQLLQNEYDGEARKSNSKTRFCLFAAFSPFPLSGRWRLAQGHSSLILV